MNDMINNELIVERNPRSSVAEALRIIRTNLQFSSADKKVLLLYQEKGKVLQVLI